jgi:hypothetical protein
MFQLGEKAFIGQKAVDFVGVCVNGGRMGRRGKNDEK